MKLLLTTVLVISFGGLCLSGGRGRGRQGIKLKDIIEGNNEAAEEVGEENRQGKGR